MASEREEDGIAEAIEAEAALLEAARSRLRDSRMHLGAWRTEAREDFAFVAGDQWSETDIAVLREQNRPVVAFNRTAPIIDAVCGSEVLNRQETTFIPRELGDVRPNEVLTAAGKWARDQCDAEDEESDAFRDTIICGLGWTNTEMDYEEDQDGKIRIGRVDPLEMFYDPAATKPNLVDARWLMRLKRLTRAEIAGKWPDKEDEIAMGDDSWQIEHDGEPINVPPGDRYDGHPMTRDQRYNRDRVTIVEYQWYETRPTWRVVSPSGQIEKLDTRTFEAAREKMRRVGVELDGVRVPERVYHRAFIAGGVILEQGPCPCPTSFTYKAITGKRDRNTNTWYGLVRGMKDPQRWANKWLSQILHIINANAKGGVMAEIGAVENVRKFEEDWARADATIWLRDGAISRGQIQQRQAITYPHGLDKLMDFAITSIRDVSGVNLELLGQADRQQAGVLEYQRKQSAITILAGLFDNLRRYRKEQGRVLMHFIQAYISDGRLIRIVTGEQRAYVPLMRQPGVRTYDVVVDDAPSSPNQKEKVFTILQSLLPSLLKAGVPMPPSLLDYTPLPDALIQDWKKQLQQAQAGEVSPQVQAAMQQMSERLQKITQMAEKLANENQQLRMKRDEKIAELRLDRSLKTEEHELKRTEIERDYALKAEAAQREFDLKMAALRADAALQGHKIEMEKDKQMETAARTEAQISEIKQSRKARVRKVKVVRDGNGYITGAEIQEMEPQGNA